MNHYTVSECTKTWGNHIQGKLNSIMEALKYVFGDWVVSKDDHVDAACSTNYSKQRITVKKCYFQTHSTRPLLRPDKSYIN